MDPHGMRQRDERRLTGLKVAVVGVAVAGLGVFAGLAAAGTDDVPAGTPTAPATGSMDQYAADSARLAEDESFFDDEARGGAVGDYGSRGHDGDDWGDEQGYAAGSSAGYAPSQGSTGGS